jgi:phosphoribosyl 1,2-cyclic phosphodiesterase
MVECGLTYQDIRKRLLAIDLSVNDLSGCLVTHAHQDHCQGAFQLSRYTTIYASEFTLSQLDLFNEQKLVEWRGYRVGDFTVIGFPVEHDINGAYGFILYADDEWLLFINDTKYIEYDLSKFKFDYVMIESNYNDDLIDSDDIRNKRTINSHMALSTTLSTLKSLNQENIQEIYLMHLSNGNSNERVMIDTICNELKRKVYACRKHGGVNE